MMFILLYFSTVFAQITSNNTANEWPSYYTYLQCVSADPAYVLKAVGFLDAKAIIGGSDGTSSSTAMMNLFVESDIEEVTVDGITLVTGNATAIPEGYLNFQGSSSPFGNGGPSFKYSLKYLKTVSQAEATYELEFKVDFIDDAKTYRLICEASM